MSEPTCTHQWSIVNLHSGYLVTEGCAETMARISWFTLEDRPPIDSYVHGGHIWKHLSSAQAVEFDLQCTRCGKLQPLDSIVAMMLCTLCMEDCPVADKSSPEDQRWVYIARCRDTTHEGGRCVDETERAALEHHYNSRLRTPGKQVRFVPCREVPSMGACEGEIICDTGLTDLY